MKFEGTRIDFIGFATVTAVGYLSINLFFNFQKFLGGGWTLDPKLHENSKKMITRTDENGEPKSNLYCLL